MARPPLIRPAAGDPPGAGGPAPRDPVMQRVRVGVTGLSAVFLLTLLAAATLSFLSPANESAPAANAAANTADAPREPLAELGVAPGNPPAPAGNQAAPVRRPPAIAPPVAPSDLAPPAVPLASGGKAGG